VTIRRASNQPSRRFPAHSIVGSTEPFSKANFFKMNLFLPDRHSSSPGAACLQTRHPNQRLRSAIFSRLKPRVFSIRSIPHPQVLPPPPLPAPRPPSSSGSTPSRPSTTSCSLACLRLCQYLPRPKFVPIPCGRALCYVSIELVSADSMSGRDARRGGALAPFCSPQTAVSSTQRPAPRPRIPPQDPCRCISDRA